MKILKLHRFDEVAEKSPGELKEKIGKEHPCMLSYISEIAVINDALGRLYEKGFVKSSSKGEAKCYSYQP